MERQGTTHRATDAIYQAHDELIAKAEEFEKRARLLELSADSAKHVGIQSARLSEASNLKTEAASLRAQAKRYPRKAGHRGVATSKAAAALVDQGLKKRQRQVLDLLREGEATNSELFQRASGLSDEQMAKYVRLRQLERGLQPRTGELSKLELVVDTGERRDGPTGNAEIVWAVADHVRQERI